MTVETVWRYSFSKMGTAIFLCCYPGVTLESRLSQAVQINGKEENAKDNIVKRKKKLENR